MSDDDRIVRVHLGSLSGTGSLVMGNILRETVEYEIEVFEQNDTIGATGTLQGPDKTLVRAFAAAIVGPPPTLVLENGASLEFRIVSLSGGLAEITVSGPIPGFRQAGDT